ncbi:MAG: Rrf2 family transcriptional regulator [Candidatus Omnitrophica bacterium]|nr:Rrf2 family transcriptional regulator [Candidatus Omnitrophota bacterium]MDD5488552.1 Rrf2 family transcriptional regulator [Candidatus Omnitrophota bacterium]
MKLLTKDTDYAVRALIELGVSGETYVSAREISEKQQIPYQFLRRIMQDLIKGGLVKSKEGGGGGFRLRGHPLKIKVADVIRMFQGEIELSECMFRKKICANRPHCVLRSNIKNIEAKVIKEFEKITIGQLIRQAIQRNKA